MIEQNNKELTVDDWLRVLKLKDKYEYDEENLKIISFVFLWMKFNNYYKSKKGSFEIDRIKNSKNDEMETKYQSKKEVYIKTFSEIPTSMDKIRKAIFNHYRNKDLTYDVNNNSLEQFLEVVYTIRCNFFHGHKAPNKTDKKLIAWAYDCLKEVLEPIFIS